MTDHINTGQHSSLSSRVGDRAVLIAFVFILTLVDLLLEVSSAWAVQLVRVLDEFVARIYKWYREEHETA